MKHLLISLFCISLLACCKDDEEVTPPREPADRTVLVYMAAENDLSYFSRQNLADLITGRKEVNEREDLIVFVDKASSSEKPFIARITSNTEHPLDTLYKYTEDFYASDPLRFQEVLQWVVTNCPAKKDYGLVLWGHGNGWIIENDSVAIPQNARRRAYGIDSGTNVAQRKGMWMNIGSMRQAMEQLNVKWKFIFCDCCNMQCVELAYELRNITDYIIGSPAEITGVGAPYKTMVKDFFIQDDATMYTSLCNDYYAQITHELGKGDEHLPICTVRTANMTDLANATRTVLPQVADYLKTAEAMNGTIYYYSYSYNNQYEKTMYDMNDVIQTALGCDSQAYKDWKEVFDQTVLSPFKSSLWHGVTVNFNDFEVTEERQGVISMFFPMEKYNFVSHHYNETIKKTGWYYAIGWPAVGW